MFRSVLNVSIKVYKTLINIKQPSLRYLIILLCNNLFKLQKDFMDTLYYIDLNCILIILKVKSFCSFTYMINSVHHIALLENRTLFHGLHESTL